MPHTCEAGVGGCAANPPPVQRPSIVGAVASLAFTALAVTGCASHSAQEPVAADTVNPTMVAAGVARIQWGLQDADLNIRQMDGLDAVGPSETSCAHGLPSGRVLYFDLNWRGVVNKQTVDGITLTILGPDGAALTVAEPDGRCVPLRDYRIDALPPLNGEQYVLQLIGLRGPAQRGPVRLAVVFDGHRESLRLVPACTPNQGQDAGLSCPIDPVSFDENSAYSVRWDLNQFR